VTAAWLAVYHNAAKDWDLYELAERLWTWIIASSSGASSI